MATTYETPNFRDVSIFAANFPGVIDRTVEIDLEAVTADATYAFIINDVIKVCRLPQGAKLLYGRLECDDLDDDGTPTVELDLSVTDGTTTYILVNGTGTTIAEAGGALDSRSTMVTDVVGSVLANPDFYLQVKCRAAATGDAGASAKIKATVGYTMAVESNEYNRDFPSPIPT